MSYEVLLDMFRLKLSESSTFEAEQTAATNLLSAINNEALQSSLNKAFAYIDVTQSIFPQMINEMDTQTKQFHALAKTESEQHDESIKLKQKKKEFREAFKKFEENKISEKQMSQVTTYISTMPDIIADAIIADAIQIIYKAAETIDNMISTKKRPFYINTTVSYQIIRAKELLKTENNALKSSLNNAFQYIGAMHSIYPELIRQMDAQNKKLASYAKTYSTKQSKTLSTMFKESEEESKDSREFNEEKISKQQMSQVTRYINNIVHAKNSALQVAVNVITQYLMDYESGQIRPQDPLAAGKQLYKVIPKNVLKREKKRATFRGRKRATFRGQKRATFRGRKRATFRGQKRATFRGRKRATFRGRKRATFRGPSP
jgi:hypothetical protein